MNAHAQLALGPSTARWLFVDTFQKDFFLLHLSSSFSQECRRGSFFFSFSFFYYVAGAAREPLTYNQVSAGPFSSMSTRECKIDLK